MHQEMTPVIGACNGGVIMYSKGYQQEELSVVSYRLACGGLPLEIRMNVPALLTPTGLCRWVSKSIDCDNNLIMVLMQGSSLSRKHSRTSTYPGDMFPCTTKIA